MKVLVLTGWGYSSLNEYRDIWAEIEPDYIADNLLDAVKWIIDRSKVSPKYKKIAHLYGTHDE